MKAAAAKPASLRAGSVAAGHGFDSNHPSIVHVLRGIARAKPRAPKQAEPLRGVELLGVLARIGRRPIDLRDAALLALGYAFGLRRSELVGLDYGEHGEGDGFIRITPRAIELTLTRTKTSLAEPQIVTMPRETNTEVVRRIEAWV